MKINKLRWKNFTSWGNSWQELKFDTNAGLSLICGVNGSGKSSISNLIIYMLYGQLDGFTQKDIPNRINKHFEGEIIFDSNNHDIYIYRALAPNDFKVIVDGKSIDTAGKNNVQKWLEDEIYGISYSIFRNSIVLSVNDFKSFVDLTPKEKRDIIDKLFGYSVINAASLKIKETLKTIKSKIESCETNIDGYESSIKEIDSAINDLENKQIDLKPIESELKDINEKLADSAKKYKQVLTDTETTKNNLLDVKEKRHELSNELSSIKSKLDLYDKGICPLCGSKLDTEEHVHIKEQLLEKTKKSNKTYSNICKKYEQISNDYENILAEKENLVDSINELKLEKTKTNTKLEEQSKAKEDQISNFEIMKKNIKDKISPKKEELSQLNKKNDVLEIVSDIFSETGLKQYISNMYIPMINGYVDDVCQKLGIAYKVMFTTGYDCEITFMGDEVNYKTLSNGERKKIDIAVTLAFLKIIKTKISDINLLFLDEVLSSIDVASCNELLKIFYDFSRDTNLRIYMVHHANLDSTWVDNVIEIEKHNGFSHFI